MKVIVFGASGQTGKQVVELALAAGHEVVAALRDINQLPDQPNLVRVKCDVMDSASLAFVTELNADHVVVVLGTKQLGNNHIRSQGTSNIMAVLSHSENTNTRVWLLSAAGVGDSWQQIGWFSKLISKLMLNHTMQEHTAQEHAVTNSGFAHTILRAVGLTNSDKATYQLVSQGSLPSMQVSRKAIASCIVEQLATPNQANQIACICSAGKS